MAAIAAFSIVEVIETLFASFCTVFMYSIDNLRLVSSRVAVITRGALSGRQPD